ncbi:hypothetical protein [Actinomycetospora sp. CA-084318]
MTGPDDGRIDPADPRFDAVPLPPEGDDAALPLPDWDPLPPDDV